MDGPKPSAGDSESLQSFPRNDALASARADSSRMTRQHIRLKAVRDLRLDEAGKPTRYFIAAYQRGFRWTDIQVTQLLEDVEEFTRRKNPQPDEFYCLQPLVLLPRKDGSFEVVDGQQRLTSLLLVLRHFNERAAEKYRQPVYTLEYATRPGLATFLKDPSDEEAKKNIDFFHIAQAMKVIEAWFGARESEVEAIKDTFLNRVKVIWFELSPTESPVAAFTRLNVGKIPLTNAELIRALFLRSAPGESAETRQLQIAYEWDLVEKTLQQQAFWAFISNDTGRSGSRIEFLFDLAARQQGMAPSADAYATFNHFGQLLTRKTADPGEAWLEVKRICMLLEEWYADRQIYHLAGFLIWAGAGVNDLRALADGVTKSELKETLRTAAAKRAFGSLPHQDADDVSAWVGEQIDELEYPSKRRQIRSILLLFNVATLLLHPQSNIRFNFDSFKQANWDIEHVRSVAAEELGSPTLQAEWLRQTRRFLELVTQDPEAAALTATIDAHLEMSPTDRLAAFEPLYAELLKYFHEDDDGEPDNGIANLVLLDQETNRSYKNAVFPVKRQRVAELDAHGIYVPHCTRNVFLKAYSPRVGHTMYWTREDREDYKNHLISTLSEFVKGDWVRV